MEDKKNPPSVSEHSLTAPLPGAGKDSITTSSWGTPRDGKEPSFPVQDWDRYEYLRFLGQGGMGRVFLCRDRKLGREVAIKFLRMDDDDYHLQRFMAEARAQAQVDHGNVCKVFEVGEVQGRVFITMQHIAGSSLDAAAPELSLEQKVIVLRDAAWGVHEAHRVGIIHRDLKPSNIMVERAEDGSLKTFVMDFGLARERNQEATEPGSLLGTPAYMSPEQARGEVSLLDRRSDVYSLGATLYQVLTGRHAIGGSNPLEILSAIPSADVQPMRNLRLDIPQDVEAITLKCLEKERSARYDSARALAEDLDRFLAGEPVQARSTGAWYQAQRWLQKHKELTSIGTIALLLVLVAVGSSIKARRDAGRRERLAQQFTESLADIESMARYSALSPLHDIRPDLMAVKAHMARLQEDMRQAGALANGPGNYALGRGHLTLEDGEKAREHLQMAWDAGFREPRVAYALATALARQYQVKLLEAERIPTTEQREVRRKEIETALRAPALAFLRQARGSDAPSPAYLEALMAFCEGRLEDALARLKTLGDEQPWFYEAPLLRGTLIQARAWKRWNQGQREEALADFATGRRDLAIAAASGRSAPAVHAALAELELNVLIMEKYGQGRVEPAFERGMAAVQTALTAQADHVPSLILQAALLGHLADFRTSLGESADDLVQQAVASARKAVDSGPTRAAAWAELGKAYYQWGNARQEQDLDPSEQLGRGLQALESLSPEKRDYVVENHIGLIHQTWSDFENQHGQDPLAHLNGAIAAYERATRMEPRLLPAWINLGTCLEQRATQPQAANPDADLQAALKVLEQAHALNPKHFVPYFVQGKVLTDLALRKQDRNEDPGPDFLRSVEATRQGIAINPGNPQLHNGVGFAQRHLAQYIWETGGDPLPLLAQAQEAYRRAIAVAPKQMNAYINLGDLLIWKARHQRGPGSGQSVSEAEATLQKALLAAPNNKGALVNLGRVFAVRLEGAQAGADPAPLLQRGEAFLVKALALDARDRETLQALGELRAAAAQGKALARRAVKKNFEDAAQPFERALELAPESLETRLSLARLCRSRGEWERSAGQDPAGTIAKGRAWLAPTLKARPKWGEAVALRGALSLLEAESLPPAKRSAKALEARKDGTEAMVLNRNLAAEGKLLAERAKRLE